MENSLKQKNTKLQGQVGLNAAMLYYSSLGYSCYTSAGDQSVIDLIIERDGETKRVQVKTTTGKARKEFAWDVLLTTQGGNRSWNGIRKKINETPFDILFVLTQSWDIYELSREEVNNRNKLILPSKETIKYFKGRMFQNDHQTPEEVLKISKSKIGRGGRRKKIIDDVQVDCDVQKEKSKYKHKTKFDVSKEELENLLNENSYNYCQVAKIFNVSDNAVRKRAKKFGLNTHSRSYRKERGINIYKA